MRNGKVGWGALLVALLVTMLVLPSMAGVAQAADPDIFNIDSGSVSYTQGTDDDGAFIDWREYQRSLKDFFFWFFLLQLTGRG